MTRVEQYLYIYQFYSKPKAGGDNRGDVVPFEGVRAVYLFISRKFLYLRCVLVNNLFCSRASNLV